MKKDVYNHVLTKYKRLGPFSNPKSEKGAGDMHLNITENMMNATVQAMNGITKAVNVIAKPMNVIPKMMNAIVKTMNSPRLPFLLKVYGKFQILLCAQILHPSTLSQFVNTPPFLQDNAANTTTPQT